MRTNCTLSNPLNDYMNEHNILNGAMAEMLGVSYSTVHRYRHNGIVPSLDVALKIYKVTGGRVPLIFWGYTIVNGKFVRPPKAHAHRLKGAKYSPFKDD